MKALRRIVLGSSSPDRQQVLRTAGIPFEVLVAGIDEKAIRFDDPIELTLALAYAKRDAILSTLGAREHCVLVTADQVAVYRGEIREKPENAEQARQWLLEYGQDGHEVSFVTGLLVTDVRSGKKAAEAFAADTARVALTPMIPAVVEALLLKGKVLGVAGAFTLENPLVAAHVTSVTNTQDDPIDAETSVQGLPLVQTINMLRDFGALAA